MTCPVRLLDGRERVCLNVTPGHTDHTYQRTQGLLRLEVIEGSVVADSVGVPGIPSAAHAPLSPDVTPTEFGAPDPHPVGVPTSPGSAGTCRPTGPGGIQDDLWAMTGRVLGHVRSSVLRQYGQQS